MILAESTSAPEFPEKSSAIRVKKFTQKLAVQSDGGRGSKGKIRVPHTGASARAT